MKRGPALGFIPMLATQRPDANSIPTGISANAGLRMCLKVMGQVENDMVLGTSMYKNGDQGNHVQPARTRASSTSPARAQPGHHARLRVRHARSPRSSPPAPGSMREAAGRLTGYALGEDADVEVRSIAEDVLLVFRDDPKLYLTTIAARLAESIPGAYADITPEAVASQLPTSARPPRRSASPAGRRWPGSSGPPSSPCWGAPMCSRWPRNTVFR